MSLQILSLGEIMNQYRVVHLIEVMGSLKHLGRVVGDFCDGGNREQIIKKGESSAEVIVPIIDTCKAECTLLEMSLALRRIAELNSHLVFGITYGHLAVEVNQLLRDMHEALNDRTFAYIPIERAGKHGKMLKEWHKVIETFPESWKDIQDASDSLALELYTASVFHAMRIAQVGLLSLARKLDVTIRDKGVDVPVEEGDWNKVLTAVRNKIEKTRESPKNAKHTKELHHFSNAADHLTWMKDIWRNSVSHGESYIEYESAGALERVRLFMEFLAKGFV